MNTIVEQFKTEYKLEKMLDHYLDFGEKFCMDDIRGDIDECYIISTVHPVKLTFNKDTTCNYINCTHETTKTSVNYLTIESQAAIEVTSGRERRMVKDLWPVSTWLNTADEVTSMTFEATYMHTIIQVWRIIK